MGSTSRGTVENLSIAERRIIVTAAGLVSRYVDTRDREVRLPLIAMTRRCLEVVTGTRRPAPHSGLPISPVTHEVVLEADQAGKLDVAAQQMLARMATMGDPVAACERLGQVETTVFDVPFLSDAGLELNRVTIPDDALARYTLHNIDTGLDTPSKL
ncbi:hypothetical protein KDA23_06425 [Candidatus Saccharibacteria bacterium]|nr:hypothetical protein [Candidatus Saccharibacteria bacterium]